MKARLLVHIYSRDRDMVHQEMPEVEFNNFDELDDALQIKWSRISEVNTGPMSPHRILFDIWNNHGRGQQSSVIRVMQVLLLNDLAHRNRRSDAERNRDLGDVLPLPV